MVEPFLVDRFRIDVTATLGLAMAGDVTGEEALSRLDALLRHADGAMLDAKLAGKRRVGRIRRGRAPSSFVREALIRRRLPHALLDGALTLHYQPLRDLATGVDHGVEALLRWTDVELGTVPAAEFVPVAEHTGEILRIGAWVIDRACAQARSWADAGTPLKIAVNVSPVQLAAGTLDTDIMGALELHGIPAGLLDIEITEGTAILDLPGAAAQLQQLIDAGLGVVLDDYGTAQASLATLLALPLTRVKIAKGGDVVPAESTPATSTSFLMAVKRNGDGDET